MNRVFAVAVAVLLIVGAVIVRGVIDDDEDGGNGNPDGRTTMRVVCAEELRDACEGLGFGARFEIEIEDAADTAARLATATAADIPDIWAVPAPWPAIVDDTRVRAGRQALYSATPDVLASTRLAAVGPESLAGCDWSCIGERAGTSVRVGTRPLASTGVGVLTLGAAAAGYFGGPQFATNDFDPTFDRWLAGFTGAVTDSAGPVLQLLQSRAFFDVALSYEAEAAAALDAASVDRKQGLALLYPAPVVTLDAVVVLGPGASSSDAGDLRSALGESLLTTGWSEPSTAPSGLPSAGVITALRERAR